jgi:hypothetical protein
MNWIAIYVQAGACTCLVSRNKQRVRDASQWCRCSLSLHSYAYWNITARQRARNTMECTLRFDVSHVGSGCGIYGTLQKPY